MSVLEEDLRELAHRWIQDARNNGVGHKESCAWDLLLLLNKKEIDEAWARGERAAVETSDGHAEDCASMYEDPCNPGTGWPCDCGAVSEEARQ